MPIFLSTDAAIWSNTASNKSFKFSVTFTFTATDNSGKNKSENKICFKCKTDAAATCKYSFIRC